MAPEGPGTGLPAILIPGLSAHPQLSGFDLRSRLSRFIAEDPQDLALPLEEAETLSAEAFRLWAVAASYGLGSDLYRWEEVMVVPSRPLQPCNSALLEVQAQREAGHEEEVILGGMKTVGASGLARG